MSTLIQFKAGELPEGTCYPGTVQELFDLFVANLNGQLADNVTLFNFGPNQPPVDRQDQPWIRTDSNGKFLGVYTFDEGAWEPADPPFTTGDVMFVPRAQTVAAPWYICNGQTVNGIVLPDMRGLFPVGAGQRTLPSGSIDTATVFAVGATGGAEQVALTQPQMPPHDHTPDQVAFPGAAAFVCAGTGGGDGTIGGAGANNPKTSIAGGESDGVTTQPHPNLPPWIGGTWKMYISAEDAGIHN